MQVEQQQQQEQEPQQQQQQSEQQVVESQLALCDQLSEGDGLDVPLPVAQGSSTSRSPQTRCLGVTLQVAANDLQQLMHSRWVNVCLCVNIVCFVSSQGNCALVASNVST